MSRVRTFIAVELTESIRAEIEDLQHEFERAGTEVKWTEPENLHVTLVFLGEVDDKEIPTVCRIAAQAVAGMGPFPLSVEGVGCFPNARRPRVVWVGVGQGQDELVRIHDALETPLLDLGYRREDRKYTPHITLGRAKSDRPTERLSAAIARQAGWKAGDMTVTEILVMGSELTRDGPIYTVLGRVKL
jgi:2'-5' RNA ligase